MTVQSRGAILAATPSFCRPSSSLYSAAIGMSPFTAWSPLTSGCSVMLRDCATSAFLSGSPWAISSPSGATTIAKPCSPMRIRSTMRHISSRLNSPTSQPDGWFSRLR